MTINPRRWHPCDRADSCVYSTLCPHYNECITIETDDEYCGPPATPPNPATVARWIQHSTPVSLNQWKQEMLALTGRVIVANNEAELLRVVFDATPYDGVFTIDTNGEMLRFNVQYDDATQAVVLDLVDAMQVSDVVSEWVKQRRAYLRAAAARWK